MSDHAVVSRTPSREPPSTWAASSTDDGVFISPGLRAGKFPLHASRIEANPVLYDLAPFDTEDIHTLEDNWCVVPCTRGLKPVGYFVALLDGDAEMRPDQGQL
jgi:hypothetical protein